MPFISLTKGSKSYGVQTYARAKRLSEPLQSVEMEYLDDLLGWPRATSAHLRVANHLPA